MCVVYHSQNYHTNKRLRKITLPSYIPIPTLNINCWAEEVRSRMRLPRMLRTLDLPGIVVHSLNGEGDTGVVHQLRAAWATWQVPG